MYMNDIPHAIDYFDFILYADDTSLYRKNENTIYVPCWHKWWAKSYVRLISSNQIVFK